MTDLGRRTPPTRVPPEEQTLHDGLPTILERMFLDAMPQHWIGRGQLEIRYSFRADLVGEPNPRYRR